MREQRPDAAGCTSQSAHPPAAQAAIVAPEIGVGPFGRYYERLPADASCLPGSLGSYALVLVLAEPVTVRVGALGVHDLAAGRYVYCGSAFGPGGLSGRVSRHLRGGTKRHWHIDALRAAAPVMEVWVSESADRLECALSTSLASLPGAGRPVAGFGSSDCGCPGHLVWLRPI